MPILRVSRVLRTPWPFRSSGVSRTSRHSRVSRTSPTSPTSGTPRRPVRAVAAAALGVLTAAVVAVPGLLAVPAHADTVRGLAWHLDALRIEEAHRISRGREEVVAVIGGGVDADHPDLKGRVLRGHSFDTAVAADGREEVDGGRATGMAGLIVGPGGSDMRLLGIAPDARILPVNLGRRYDHETYGQAIRWAVRNDARVIVLSENLRFCLQEDIEAVRYALSSDVVVVAPAGDNRDDYNLRCPASIPGVVSVGGTTRSGKLWSGSVVGRQVALAAPAEKIIVPLPRRESGNGYGVGSSTGDAAAIVAGVAALIRSKEPRLRARDVINRLVSTAHDSPLLSDKAAFSHGVVDPVRALTAKVGTVKANPLGTPPPSPTPTPRPEPTEDDGPWIEFGVSSVPGAIAQTVVMVLVPVLVVFFVIRNRRQARREGAAPAVPLSPSAPLPPYGAPPGGPYAPPPPYGMPPGGPVPSPGGAFPPPGPAGPAYLPPPHGPGSPHPHQMPPSPRPHQGPPYPSHDRGPVTPHPSHQATPYPAHQTPPSPYPAHQAPPGPARHPQPPPHGTPVPPLPPRVEPPPHAAQGPYGPTPPVPGHEPTGPDGTRVLPAGPWPPPPPPGRG
ncbi:S8 family serine peptidase [Streptosporangium sp. NPDC048047]|uniref:S8 family serine peptidase n=1 Tax=Streptosporangium sp. NPDC048047 TaxID=3155748 RepID=UPI003436BE3C